MVDGISKHLIRPPNRPLFVALGVSVLIHLLLGLLAHYVPQWEWARRNRVLGALISQEESLKELLANSTKLKDQSRDPEPEYPTVFVEIPKTEDLVEPPKSTKYYSDNSSVAANPEPEPLKLTEKPKLDGSQDQVIRLADNQRSQPAPPTPPAPPEPPAVQVQPEPKPPSPPIPDPAPTKPEEAPKIGELALTTPSPPLTPQTPPLSAPATPPNPNTPPPSKRVPRPRTLAQAIEQNPKLRGEKFKQAGGVKKRSVTVALDVRASLFGAYDRAVIQAIEERWFQLLEENSFSGERVGKVILEFKLKYDGSVSDLKVIETSVGDVLALLCMRAVKDPAHYAKWPSDMRLLYSSGFRDVRFTFYYN